MTKYNDPSLPIHVLGEIVLDVILYDTASVPVLDIPVWARDIRFKLGGSASYVAQGLHALGSRVVIDSFAGTDPFTGYFLEDLKSRGIDTRNILLQEGTRTSVCVGKSEKGKKQFVGCSPFLPYPPELLESPSKQAGLIYFGGLAMYPDIWDGRFANYLAAADPLTWLVVDTQLLPIAVDAYREKMMNRDNLSLIDVLLVDRVEALALTRCHRPEEAGRALLDYGPRIVVVKMGEEGALVFQAGESEVFFSSAKQIKVKEPIGAGDFFGAGFSFALLQGWALKRCADFANAFAALMISQSWEQLPGLDETLSFMNS